MATLGTGVDVLRSESFESFTNCSQLHELAKTCDRQHEHETWTMAKYHMACRKVAPDGAYNQMFSAAIASCVAYACLLPRHVRRAPPVKEDVASLTAVALQHRAAPQRLIPEYTQFFTVSVFPVHIEKGICRQVASRGSTGAAGYVQGGSSPTASFPPDGVCARHARCLAPSAAE